MNNNRHIARRTYHFAKRIAETQKPTASRDSAWKTIVVKINVVTPLASLVFGRQHSVKHRLLAGVVVMAIGVIIAKYVGHSPNAVIAHVGDGVGFGLHGMGLIPFIEWFASKFE